MINHVLLLHFMVLFKYACPEELIIHFDTPYCKVSRYILWNADHQMFEGYIFELVWIPQKIRWNKDFLKNRLLPALRDRSTKDVQQKPQLESTNSQFMSDTDLHLMSAFTHHSSLSDTFNLSVWLNTSE